MPKTKNYQEDLLEDLRDPSEAAGGMTRLSERTKLNRENHYRMLSEKGNPELRSLGVLLRALEFRLAVAVKKAS